MNPIVFGCCYSYAFWGRLVNSVIASSVLLWVFLCRYYIEMFQLIKFEKRLMCISIKSSFYQVGFEKVF